MNTLIELFKKHAKQASFHYADDTCKEWNLAREEKKMALKIFDENPELQTELRELAKNELWRINRERPL